MDPKEQAMKLKIIDSLLDYLSDGMSKRMKPDMPEPKALGVSVEAPDKEHLAEGLDKAKDLLSQAEPSEMPAHDEDDDESRLRDLLGDEDDEKDM